MLLAYKWCFIWQIKLFGCLTAKRTFLKSPSQYLFLSGPVHATQIWWHAIISALHLVVTTPVLCVHFSLLWLSWHNIHKPLCAVGRVTSSSLLLADRIGFSKGEWLWFIFFNAQTLGELNSRGKVAYVLNPQNHRTGDSNGFQHSLLYAMVAAGVIPGWVYNHWTGHSTKG